MATLDKGIIMIGPYEIKEAPDPEVKIKTPKKENPDDVEND